MSSDNIGLPASRYGWGGQVDRNADQWLSDEELALLNGHQSKELVDCSMDHQGVAPAACCKQIDDALPPPDLSVEQAALIVATQSESTFQYVMEYALRDQKPGDGLQRKAAFAPALFDALDTREPGTAAQRFAHAIADNLMAAREGVLAMLSTVQSTPFDPADSQLIEELYESATTQACQWMLALGGKARLEVIKALPEVNVSVAETLWQECGVAPQPRKRSVDASLRS